MNRHLTGQIRSSHIGPETPLRLDVAAALAYPDGSMTASGLRREARRGRLVIERTAGKDYTTLGHINRMREQCRLEAKDPGCIFDARAATMKAHIHRSGLSSTAKISAARAALHTILREPNAPSPNISPASMPEPHGKSGAVIPMKSLSPTS
jgi:hypothetical protein